MHTTKVGYYQNGQKDFEQNYKNDLREGLSMGWWENGNIHYEIEYKNGLREGLAIWFFENGQKKLTAQFKEGGRECVFKSFDFNDIVENFKTYKNNRASGVEIILNYK